MNISTKTITTLSSREFNQNTARAKRAAQERPVFITTRGRLSHVLMSIEGYERMKRGFVSLADALADPRPEADFDWEPPPRGRIGVPDLDD